MLRKIEIEEHVQDDQVEVKEKIESALCTLQELRGRIAELKRKCEELRRMESQRPETMAVDATRCDKCGHPVDTEDQVVVRDSNGEERRHYHNKCFQTLLK